jgi:hypothetical protein
MARRQASSLERCAARRQGEVRQRLGELRLNCDSLVEEQKALSYSDAQGTRKRLEDAATQVEQLIRDGIQALSETERTWLRQALLTIRRYEAQYRGIRLRPDPRRCVDALTTPRANARFFLLYFHRGIAKSSVQAPPRQIYRRWK